MTTRPFLDRQRDVARDKAFQVLTDLKVINPTRPALYRQFKRISEEVGDAIFEALYEAELLEQRKKSGLSHIPTL